MPWLAGKKGILKPSSYRPLESAWRIHVQPTWGQKQIGTIRHSEVQKWVSQLSETHGPTVVIRAHNILSAILDVAVRDRLISTNDAKGVGLPKKSVKRKAYLSFEQVELLASKSASYGPLVLTMAYTGLRWGEVTALRVQDYDPAKRRLTVNENAVDVSGTIHVGKPKSHKSRSVPIAGFLVRLLNEATSGKQPLDLIFGDGRNYVRQSTSGRGWFAKAVRLSQKDDETFPRVTPHDLRHTAASLAVSAGANVKAVQRMLGHASAAMTLDTYADLFDDDLDAVAVGLDTARSSRIVSMSVSMAPKPCAKEPLPPLVSKDVGVLSLAVPVGFVPGVETPLDALRLTAPPWAHPGRFANTYQSTN
jgi:integrase